MPQPTRQIDTLIIGAGAAGMQAGAFAAARGGSVLVIDHAKAPGEKIRISGGGRCNFTNLHTEPGAFLSQNPHFAKSALKRYTQWDFIDLVARHGIAYHEKTLGQLFCDNSAKDIIRMLLDEMARTGAQLWLSTKLLGVVRTAEGFEVELERDGTQHRVRARHLVIACGGKSIPKMGATGLGYDLAEQFGLAVTETRPALVPLTFTDALLNWCKALAGVAVPAARVSCDGTGGRARFDEAVLFTHRGLSGPAVLQISSFWREGEAVALDLAPGFDLAAHLKQRRQEAGRQRLATVLGESLPNRLASAVIDAVLDEDAGGARTKDGDRQGNGNGNGDGDGHRNQTRDETRAALRIGDQPDRVLSAIARRVGNWQVTPTGTEGYRTAEVTLGGVDTAGLSSRDMQAREVPGLYFIGEAVDVTGWLGGYNFQWAWSSGWAAGTAIAERA